MQQLWPRGRDAFTNKEIDWDGDSFLFIAFDSTYTFNPAHENRDDLTGVLGTTALSGMARVGNGVCDADDVSILIGTPAATVRAVGICLDSGSAATDTLIYFANTSTDNVAINRVSDGVNNINFIWSNGPSRIFRI